MIKNNSCPVSLQRIDGTIARIVAFFVIVLIIAYLYTSQILFLYILAIDFFTRIYLQKSYSVIFQLSKFVKKVLKLESKLTDNAPKKLAAQFGLLFSVILIIVALLDYQIFIYITISIFLLCAALEVLFDYCIGCKIYHIFSKGSSL